MVSSKSTHKKLVLLDTHAIIHRAYHALPEFVNSKGEPTGALYGLATMLFKIITDLAPDYIVACYDLPKKTFRHEAYDNYKAGRAKTDDSLVSQIIRSREFFASLSIPMYECAGFEADDLLGTIPEILKKEKNLDIVIASGDMDTLQLVDGEHVTVYTLKKGINDTILYTQKKVEERFGFKPQYLPDYKGLRGDPSDNIIGIKGIGEKTATTLVVAYGTLEKMYQDIKKNPEKIKALGVTDRVFNLLKEGVDEAMFSKTLATIRRDAPIDFTLPESPWRQTVVISQVQELFRTLEFKSLQNRFIDVLEKEVSKDGISIKTNNEDNQTPSEDSLSKGDKELFVKAKIAFWLLNSEQTNPSLDDVIHYKESNSLKEALDLLESDIKKENLDYVYRSIELPLIPIISDMQNVGIMVDVKYLQTLSKEYHIELSKIEKDIFKHANREFNVNSPKQLGEVLFDGMGLTARNMKKSASGARSTKESELEKLRDLHPIIEEILRYRELQKLLSTYIDTIPALVEKDSRLRATFLQTGTSTGRFSSNNPNLQNIPIKTEKGKKIRNAFVAQKGYVLAGFDYSQIELRAAALLSQDSYFINAFKVGKDIHTAVAMKVFNVSEKDVTPDMRRRAKVINFGILYGMGVTALRANLGGERKDAQIFYDNYFAEFPTIAKYLESIKEFAKTHGYTETLFGRKRYFPGIKSPLPFIKAMAERMATNAPIQGTATADIIKIGMKRAYDALAKEGILSEVRLVLQVHDELIYEIKEDLIDRASVIIKEAMVNAIPDEFLKGMEKVPLEVSFDVGKTWGDL
jgi:DNA polymerase-1